MICSSKSYHFHIIGLNPADIVGVQLHLIPSYLAICIDAALENMKLGAPMQSKSHLLGIGRRLLHEGGFEGGEHYIIAALEM